MNMLPIPALDGGRVFLLLVTALIEAITRKKLDPRYEGYIHAAGMVLLLALMAFVMFNDILRIVKG
jgi:regulator of sigma E protease